MLDLPIEPILPQLVAALGREGRAVLQAPPGAGKTTRVPLALLAAGIVPGRIVMLEPRRIAARAAAERLAAGLGEAVGGRVGYRIRGESRPGTAIEVVTEGILTRMLQAAPDLPGIGCLIFDEFHERGLHADLGLALALEARAALRPDLLLLVMSATLDAGPVAALMGDAPVLTAEGRAHAVETRWLDRPWRAAGGDVRFETAVADLTLAALAGSEGGVLVFLPGQAEIARTAARLAPRLGLGVVLQPLHGGLGFAEQRTALEPIARGRKLVLATAIAETSLTIPDIRVVVDSGRARRARFDPGSGMSRLVTERVTRAEAEQRRGRAGRVAPGWCFRLWTRGEEGALEGQPPPEIAGTDLTGLALELAVWGVAEPGEMAFLTAPPAPALAEARALLRELGALDASGRITGHGRELAGLPVHPRLGHMLVKSAERGAGAMAADLAALLEARDPFRRAGGGLPVDLAPRLGALRDPRRAEAEKGLMADKGALAGIRAEARRLAALVPRMRGEGLTAGAALSLAYPDRIGQRRSGAAPRYRLAGGKGAVLPEDDPLASAPFVVMADLDGDRREARVRRALPVAESDLRALHSESLRQVAICEWSVRERAVIARERLMLGALVLEDRPWTSVTSEEVVAAMIAGIRALGLDALPWTDAARRFVARVCWLRDRGAPDLPEFSPQALADTLEQWLAEDLAGITRAEGLAGLDLVAALWRRLDHADRQRLDRLAPASWSAPTGTSLAIDYSGAAPAVSVRLQELFGLGSHPAIGPDRVPLVVELLSPAGRPVQTTTDIPGFWTNTYAEVRRDLRGRYPRHPWPENPAEAAPTRRAKPRSRPG
ncbi:MAG TPA: ATP-dependent helicase HrpB [Amaricoccus sp.]|uniref:ATP-dependent helicase HrpB n=1 Tax=Amaricoccus sp. TaxID=1872485 RepID=UPI002C152856|nr:ATP-dependent helicase HrpB [Amaricoccus sp.]HMQ93061.1 ATP-dependent helicase HrpB [Amaricoccus sp.]HMR54145.1 ATP-dependent helicase HrpB [Amaricoccus sp.]HMR60834.1 ATP-dependent helicase HrpB [Amaricoccus sp.]HMU01162.1 ATP-dependent helicase HrpB [Amaricoccus sp.]